MANKGNLIRNEDRTPEELRKITSKGGKASGKARREKRTMQETARLILDMPVRAGTPEDAEYLSDIYKRDKDGNLVIDKKTGEPIPKNLTMEQAGFIAIAKKAMNGDVKAMAFIRDTAGEKPVEKVEVNGDIAKAEADIANKIAAMKARHATGAK